MRALIRLGFLFVLSAAALDSHATMVQYTATDVSGNTWQYNYSVTNNTLANPIGEFTIDFALGSYSNLSVTASPGTWSSIVAQPDPNLPADGFFDAQGLGNGLTPAGSQSGFSVMFTWLGSGTPGAQPFQIVDPNTFNTLESGTTQLAPVPLPDSVWLLLSALAGLVLFRSKTGRIAV